ASCVEHPCLDRICWDSDYLSYLAYRLFMVVDEIDHLPLWRRQLHQTLPDQCVTLPGLECDLRVVRWIFDDRSRHIVELLVRAAPEHRKRLIPRNREQPGRDLGLSLESVCLPPDIQEHLAQQILRQRRVPHHSQNEAENAHAMSRIERAHGVPLAVSNGLD